MMEWTIPRGGGILLIGSWLLNAVEFKLAGEASVHSGVILGVWRGLLGRGFHPGGGPPQLLTMPDKLNIYQVGPGIAWTSDRFVLCVCTLVIS